MNIRIVPGVGSLGLTLILLAASPALLAETVTWTNVVGGNWNSAFNWSPRRVPGPGDVAVISNPGGGPSAIAVVLDISPSVDAVVIGGNGDCSSGRSSLVMNGQALTVVNGLTIGDCGDFTLANGLLMGGGGGALIQGKMSWASGSLGGNLTLAAGARMEVVSGNDHNLPSCNFTNRGTVVWVEGRIRGGGIPGTLVDNEGDWQVGGDLQFNSDYGGDGFVLLNRGAISKTAGAGALTFNAGVSVTQVGGSIDGGSGSLLFYGGATMSAGELIGQVVLAAGAFQLAGALTTTSVHLAGGYLVGENHIQGGLTWDAGDWGAASTVTIEQGSELVIASAADHNLPGCLLTNRGQVSWLGGRVRGGGVPGTVIENLGEWDARGDTPMNADYGGAGLVFNNHGTFRKHLSNGTTSLDGGGTLLNNLGMVAVDSGALVLGGWGVGGQFSVAAASSITFNGGYYFTNGTLFSGDGIIVWGGGGFFVDGQITVPNLQQVGGSMTGGGIVIHGAFNWIAGDWNGAGFVTIDSSSTLTISSGNDHNMAGGTLVNEGTVVWNGGRIRGGGIPGSLVDNRGVWDTQGDLVINTDYGGDGMVFRNSGTFRKSAGAGVASMNGAVLNSTGTVEIKSGTLTLAAGGSLNGGQVIGAGQVLLAAGAVNIQGTQLSAVVQQVGAALTGANVIRGGYTWSSGVWNGAASVTVAPGAQLDIVSDADHDMASTAVTNAGTISWLGGRIRGGGVPGTRIENQSILEFHSDRVLNADYGLDGVVLNSSGLVHKLGTTGTTTFQSGVVFNGRKGSEVTVDSGTLVVSGGGYSVGHCTVADNTVMVFGGGYTLTNGMQFSGTGQVTFSGGLFTLTGGFSFTHLVQTGGTLSGTNVVLNGLFTFVAGTWNRANTVTVDSGGELDFASDNDHDMPNSTLVNRGKVRWMAGRIRGGGNPGTRVSNEGTWLIESDQVMNSDFAIVGLYFMNTGLLRKQATTGVTTFTGGVVLSTQGNLEMAGGSLNLYGGGQFKGGSVSGPGILNLISGYYNLQDALLSTNVVLSGTGLVGVNRILGGLTWVAGSFNNAPSVTFGQGAQVVITSENDHDLANSTLTNLGSVLWLGGRVRGGGNPGSRIYNSGSWVTKADRVLNSDYGLNGLLFINQGQFVKSDSLGATTILGSALAYAFQNPGGGVLLESGTLSMPPGFGQGGGPVTFGLAGKGAGQFGQIYVPGSVALAGALNVHIASGYIPQVGDEFQIVSSPAVSGQFTPGSIPGGITVQYRSTGVYLVVTSPITSQPLLLTPVFKDGNLEFGLQSISGQSYRIERNDDLNTSDWVPYQDINGTGGLMHIDIPVGKEPQRFFRLRAL